MDVNTGQYESTALEFKSRVEDFKPAVELNFDPTPAFGDYRRFFPEEAVSHPAKANVKLIEFLVLKYTKPGDIVLDPMAGTGSTCVIASLHGRNSICVDIEERFVEWMKQAKARVEKHPSLKPKGWMIVMQGDARRLSSLLSTIPDAVITSPPYSESLSKTRKGYTTIERLAYTRQMASTRDDNIANLPHGDIDAVITSPPYMDVMNGRGKDPGRVIERLRLKAGRGVEFSSWIKRVIERGFFQPHDVCVTMKKYGDTPGNIGSLQGETYLSAMLRVYSEVFRVLKPGGIAVVIVKPFLRNKRVVDLPLHTHLLMVKAGFKPVDVYKLRLKAQSIWRILYYKKNPDVPRLNHEYILVYSKPLTLQS